MAQDVWVNMKERERSLDSARNKVEDVWQYAKSLVRIEVNLLDFSCLIGKVQLVILSLSRVLLCSGNVKLNLLMV